MKQTITNLIERLLEGSAWSREELLWAALFVGLVFASLHLASMLITRWGDSRTSSKALICSVLVCIMGPLCAKPTDNGRIPAGLRLNELFGFRRRKRSHAAQN